MATTETSAVAAETAGASARPCVCESTHTVTATATHTHASVPTPAPAPALFVFGPENSAGIMKQHTFNIRAMQVDATHDDIYVLDDRGQVHQFSCVHTHTHTHTEAQVAAAQSSDAIGGAVVIEPVEPKLGHRILSLPGKVEQIACGSDHVLMRVQTARGHTHASFMLYALGDNRDGQCGLPVTHKPLAVPTPVPALSRLPIKRLFAGTYFSAATLVNGSIAFWGGLDGVTGARPRVCTLPARAFAPLKGSAEAAMDGAGSAVAIDIGVGYRHFVVLASNGLVYTFNAPDSKELNEDTYDAVAREEGTHGRAHANVAVEPVIEGALWGLSCRQVAANDNTSYALTDAGVLISWGNVHKASTSAPGGVPRALSDVDLATAAESNAETEFFSKVPAPTPIALGHHWRRITIARTRADAARAGEWIPANMRAHPLAERLYSFRPGCETGWSVSHVLGLTQHKKCQPVTDWVRDVRVEYPTSSDVAEEPDSVDAGNAAEPSSSALETAPILDRLDGAWASHVAQAKGLLALAGTYDPVRTASDSRAGTAWRARNALPADGIARILPSAPDAAVPDAVFLEQCATSTSESIHRQFELAFPSILCARTQHAAPAHASVGTPLVPFQPLVPLRAVEDSRLSTSAPIDHRAGDASADSTDTDEDAAGSVLSADPFQDLQNPLTLDVPAILAGDPLISADAPTDAPRRTGRVLLQCVYLHAENAARLSGLTESELRPRLDLPQSSAATRALSGDALSAASPPIPGRHATDSASTVFSAAGSMMALPRGYSITDSSAMRGVPKQLRASVTVSIGAEGQIVSGQASRGQTGEGAGAPTGNMTFYAPLNWWETSPRYAAVCDYAYGGDTWRTLLCTQLEALAQSLQARYRVSGSSSKHRRAQVRTRLAAHVWFAALRHCHERRTRMSRVLASVAPDVPLQRAGSVRTSPKPPRVHSFVVHQRLPGFPRSSSATSSEALVIPDWLSDETLDTVLAYAYEARVMLSAATYIPAGRAAHEFGAPDFLAAVEQFAVERTTRYMTAEPLASGLQACAHVPRLAAFLAVADADTARHWAAPTDAGDSRTVVTLNARALAAVVPPELRASARRFASDSSTSPFRSSRPGWNDAVEEDPLQAAGPAPSIPRGVASDSGIPYASMMEDPQLEDATGRPSAQGADPEVPTTTGAEAPAPPAPAMRRVTSWAALAAASPAKRA